jgi:hypothetical protein
MFTRRDGPTALRLELVRAMAFSQEEAVIETDQGSTRAQAAVVAVWNGSLGQVLAVIRFLDHGHVERFAFQKRITSERELDEAVQVGVRSMERVGLHMDDPGYHSLDDSSRKLRLERWNELRRPGTPSPECASAPRPIIDLPPPGAPVADLSPRSVLGRVAVVRRRIDEIKDDGEIELDIEVSPEGSS